MRFVPKRMVVVGTGIIGAEFSKQAKAAGYEVTAEINSRRATGVLPMEFEKSEDSAEIAGLLWYLSGHSNVDLAALAIPSGGDGSTELAYMAPFLQKGVPVVTAGKSALSQKWDDLRPHLDRIGRRATVGGGTGMLHDLKAWLRPDASCAIRMVVNGTMAYISGQIGKVGPDIDAAAKEAIELGYAEPPEKGRPLSIRKIYEGELKDVGYRKVPIVLNELFRARIGRSCMPSDIFSEPATEDYLRWFVEKNGSLDYVVHIGTGQPPDIQVDEPGSICANLDGVYVRGGFSCIRENDLLGTLLIPGEPGNSLVAQQGARTFAIGGLGAGPEATVASMMSDVRDLIGRPDDYVAPAAPMLRNMEHRGMQQAWQDPVNPGKVVLEVVEGKAFSGKDRRKGDRRRKFTGKVTDASLMPELADLSLGNKLGSDESRTGFFSNG